MMTPGGPGWNDPPSLSYETHSQTTARRNMLTKRVGLPELKFPEANPTDPQNQTPAAPLSAPPSCPPSGVTTTKDSRPTEGDTSSNEFQKPPTMAAAANVSIFNPLETGSGEQEYPSGAKTLVGSAENSTGDSSTASVSILTPDNMKSVKNDQVKSPDPQKDDVDITSMNINFIAELRNIVQKCQERDVISKQVMQTILKKIEVLEKQEKDKKLPEIVVSKMENLTKNLMVGKFDESWNIHLSLMCDHSSNVMQWMVGVKRLISEAKKL